MTTFYAKGGTRIVWSEAIHHRQVIAAEMGVLRPQVTIIVVTYDRPEMCEVALRSAIDAANTVSVTTHILLLDNAGPGYAEQLARRYGVEYLRMDVNRRDAAAIAIEQVRSTYVALLYDDDALAPDWLMLSLAKMEEGYDVVAASFWLTDAELNPTHARVLAPATLAYMLSGQCPVNDGALVRRSVLDGVTWHTERYTATMFSLWLDLLARGVRFGVVTEPCWYYRVHPGQMSATTPPEDAGWRAEAIAEHRPVPA